MPNHRYPPQPQQRLIAFHFNGPTCQNEGDCPQGLQFYFANVMEAEFQLDSIEAILDTETSCLVTRGAGSSGAFYAVNNFITTGTFGSSEPKEASRIANEYRSARDRIDECAVLGPKNVNLFYVDFWSYGDIVQVVQEYNMGLGTYQEQEE